MAEKAVELIRRLNELKNKIFRPRLQSAFESTICFFCYDDKMQVVPAGSGVFIKYKDEYYVLTAAHVLAEHLTDTFVILTDGEFFTPRGTACSSSMPVSGSRDDDKIDITVLKLDVLSANKMLTRFKPVDETEIEVKHKLKDFATYFCLGYPLTKSKKIWNKDEIKSTAFSYQTERIKNYDFAKFGFNSSKNIAIKYDGEVTTASNPHPHLAPNLTGISGSGLWHFYNQNQKSLIGIVIQRVKQIGFKGVVVTKIDVVMKMIEEMNKQSSPK